MIPHLSYSRFVPRLLALLLVGTTCLPLVGCATNPATGRSYLMLLSREAEMQIGAQAAPGFTEQFGGAVPDAGLQQYVSGIGERLASETEADFPELDWEFTLLDSSVINAFALPGGKVFMTRGLAERLDNEAQMAGVLGHEVGHVTAQHGNRRISKQTLFAGTVAVATAVVLGSGEDSELYKYGQVVVPALSIGGQVVLLKYGRDEELEADWLGMRYMSRLGYNPRGQLQVMQVLAEASGSSDGRPPELLSTHPYPERRISEIEKLLTTEYAGTDTTHRFYKARYRDEFLKPDSRLPPPRHDGSAPATAALGTNPAAWCALCAAVPTEPADGRLMFRPRLD